MSATDVKDLMGEKLPAGTFPAESRADFRLHISPQVRRGIEEHAKADMSVEICGVVVGHWGIDENGPYADVTDYIRCEKAASKSAEVTFTHESWAQINKEMDSKFVDSRIIGWYHSHPDFGIFLSDRDCFIHEHFFSGPGQIAYVIDPVRDLEGVFAWRNGKPTPLPHFWVGNQIRTMDAGQRNGSPDSMGHNPSAGANMQPSDGGRTRESSPLGFLTLVLGLLTALLLGYLYGGWRSRWEQQMIIEGAVAHFANAKLIREGLENDLAAVRTRLHVVNETLAKLPEPTGKPSKADIETAVKQSKLIRDNLLLCEQALARIEERYGLSESERVFLARVVAQKQAELQRLMEAPSSSSASKTRRAGPKPEQNPESAANSPAANDRPANPTPPTTEERSP
jgi:proteasome lid subunit RPN8/RPN11